MGRSLRFFLLGILVALSSAHAEDRRFHVRLSPVFRYTDEPDDAKAAPLLEKLLKKYADPHRHAALLKILRKKRPYPARAPDQATLTHACLDSKTREFTYILPKRYSRRRPAGMLVFLHGAIRQPAPGGGANEARMFAPAVKRLGLIVLGPSTYDGVEWGSPGCREHVHYAIDFMKRHFNVDEDRVYLAGDSDGGRGTYALIETEATTFAAAVPVIGAPGGVTRFANLKNLPWFAINGVDDGLFKIDRVRASIKAMQASGFDLVFEAVEGHGHDPRLFLTYADRICDFFKAHPRDPFPPTIDWQVPEDAEAGFPANTMRWIRIEKTGARGGGEFDDPPASLLRRSLPRIAALRKDNRVDITTRGVERFSVLVSPEMFDLEQPIEIHTNGTLSHRGLVASDARVILEEARFHDRKLLFVNRITVEVVPEGS